MSLIFSLLATAGLFSIGAFLFGINGGVSIVAVCALLLNLYLPVSNFLLHLFLGPFSKYMTTKAAWPNYITLAIAFRDQHPIKDYFDGNTQNLITAVAMLSIDEHFPYKSDKEKIRWMKEFKSNKNCLARWFWNLK